MSTLACVLVCLSLWSCCLLEVHSIEYSHTIYINHSTGKDSPECLTSNSPSSPCSNLTWVFQQSHKGSTHYVLSEGTHFLTEPTPPFKDLTLLAFTGAGSVISCTNTDTGLAFVNIANIAFFNVSFFNCSAVRNSTSKNFADNTIIEFKAALYFYLCESINMSHINVSHSPNATGVVVYDTNGTNVISHSNFSYNSVFELKKGYPGGGGFYVEFTYCEPGVSLCDPPTGERNKGASYEFTSCQFHYNQAGNMDTDNFTTYIIPHKYDHQAFGHGGGLSLFVKGSTSDVTFTVESCIFEGNTALWGGGFFVEFHDNTHSNNVTVNGSLFISNKCLYSTIEGTEGGGMKVGHYVYGLDDTLPVTAKRNEIKVTNCYFTENSALHGGGLSLSLAFQIANQSQLAFVHLLGNDFENNTAKLGSAANIDRLGSILRGYMAVVWVEDSMFRYNSIHYAEIIHEGGTPYQTGIGAIHVDEVPVWFRGNITFQYNKGSALSVIGAVVNFAQCHAIFTNNTGNKGAAVALLGAAYMQVSNGTFMGFDYNIAKTEGGAIYNTYISRENLKSDSNCFIRHTDPFLHPDDWNAIFIFSYNYDRAGYNPNAIHSTSIFPCSVPGGSGVTNNTLRIFCWKNWLYNDQIFNHHCDEVKHAPVSSDIGNLTLNDGQYISVYSGWPFELPIELEDDLKNKISGDTFSVTYNDTMDVNYYRKDSVVVKGDPSLPVELIIETLGNRVWHFELIVDLKPCPAGFTINNKTDTYLEQCVCSGSYGGVVLCDDTSKTIQLLNGMWIGKLNDESDEYVVMDCPLHFCESTTKDRYINVSYKSVPANDTNWDRLICGATKRRGVNCGECISGFGPAINSLTYECVNCTDINLAANIAKYIASVYLPLAALFIILIVFDIRLTTGPANAFILYCQMVTSTFDLNADGGIPSTTNADKMFRSAYRFPFGIFNLKFIENYIPPICFSSDPSFNTLSIFLLDYAVALFPLLMIILVIACLKISESCCLKNQRLGVQHRRRLLSISRLASVLSVKNKKKKINDALLPAFASFLLLSYTKFSTTSSYILNDQHPIMESGSPLSTPRVYFASQLQYNDPRYLVYFIPAVIVFSTIVVLTPLVLLDLPLKALEWCIVRVRVLKWIYPSGKVHMFLNMFQGCYRHKMQFFAGLYFLFRFVINISYVLTDTWLQQFLVQQTATTIMICLLALCQPYEWKILNYVDVLIFTIMALLNSISFYLYSFSKSDPKLSPYPLTLSVQYILVLLPLIYMIMYIVWNVTRSHHPKIKRTFANLVKPSGYEPFSTMPSDKDMSDGPSIIGPAPRRSFVDKREFEDDCEAMLSRAEDQNTYAPSLSKSVTVIEVSGRHTEGEANAFQTSATNESAMQSNSEDTHYGATNNTAIN